MMDEMMNMTTMLTKIQHGATHSIQAVWASFTLSGSRGRNLVTLFSRRRKKTSSKFLLKMEIFLFRQGDTVDMESD